MKSGNCRWEKYAGQAGYATVGEGVHFAFGVEGLGERAGGHGKVSGVVDGRRGGGGTWTL